MRLPVADPDTGRFSGFCQVAASTGEAEKEDENRGDLTEDSHFLIPFMDLLR
jgi:hypothetical protein